MYVKHLLCRTKLVLFRKDQGKDAPEIKDDEPKKNAIFLLAVNVWAKRIPMALVKKTKSRLHKF